MENSWRARLPTGNICPFCSNSHFPFCPAPPLPRYFPPPPPPLHADQLFQRHLPPLPPLPPPPPPPPQPSYDPFVVPYPPPPKIPPRPSNASPNYNRDFSANPGSNFVDIGQAKRMRFHNSSPTVAAVAEDERRLKLIRDHGAVSNGIDGGYKSFPNNTLESRNLGDQIVQNEGCFGQESNLKLKRKFEESQLANQHWENKKNIELGQSLGSKQSDDWMQGHVYGNNSSGRENHYNFERPSGNHEKHIYANTSFQEQRRNFPIEAHNLNTGFMPSQQHILEPKTAVSSLSNPNMNVGLRGLFNGQPPPPHSPPPPLPVELPGFQFAGRVASSSPYTVVQANTSASMHYSSNPYRNSNSYPEEIQAVKTSSHSPLGGKEGFIMHHPSSDKPKVIDASLILKHPHRSSRPDHIVIILRGLPGSGKSYLAKILRDLEVENGGNAPRIHSMDDYFMTEVEKVEESESSGSARGKKPVAKVVMEYCYEPEMEQAYRSSMLKAFKKTLDEGVFSFVIVDDRNLRVADFAQFWATAKNAIALNMLRGKINVRSGYEVYVLEPTYKDPVGCAARNVHNFSLTDILKMANQWEETPSLYLMLDIKSLLHGDDLEENGIEEVDMDTEDDHIGGLSGSEDTNFEKVIRPSQGDNGVSNGENKLNAVEEHPVEAVKELGKSKWSTDLDEDNFQKNEVITTKSSGLSGLIKSYGKKGKPVRWADQVGRTGFSISAGKATNISLIIGPGSGYNLRSNPLPDEEKLTQRRGEPRGRKVFQEQLRAERESFKAVFDKRKQRISGLHLGDE